MVFKIECDNCNTHLYSGIEPKSSKILLKKIHGQCTKCGKLLSSNDFVVKVIKIGS